MHWCPGGLAADLLAPWRRPQQLIVYAAGGADLTAAGLVPVDPELATTVLVVAEDQGVTMAAAADPQHGSGTPVRFADGLQVLHDLTHAPGPDAVEAAAHFRNRLRARFAAHPQ